MLNMMSVIIVIIIIRTIIFLIPWRLPTPYPTPPRPEPVVKMASIMEGPLSKWTNVMKGWQYRWFVLDYNAGLLSYYTVRSSRLWLSACLAQEVRLWKLWLVISRSARRALCLSGVGSLSWQSEASLCWWRMRTLANSKGFRMLTDQSGDSIFCPCFRNCG